MLTNSRSSVCAGAASLLLLALFGANAQAQPTFPGFPTPGTPGATGTGGVYTPFNPLGSSFNPGSTGAVPPAPYYPPYPYYPQYYMDPVGSYLYGSSAVVNSVGQYQMNVQSAQVMHQVALQKQIETTKMMFDLEKYIRENTPSFTDNQIKIAKETLKRILVNATPGEIWNGNALNILLADLDKKLPELNKITHGGKLPEATLRKMNLTDGKNGSLGILKDKGRFTWPLALVDDELIAKEKRDEIETQAGQLVTVFLNSGSFDVKTYKDLKANISNLGEKLSAKVLTIPTPEYMQAKRFLENFNNSLMSMQYPQVAQAYLAYQEFIKGGRTLPELVDYLNKQGLKFAPVLPGDEAAYEVLYSTLANYDLMFNTQLVGGKKTP